MASITRAILDVAASAGSHGIAMGRIVDALHGQGFAVEQIESAIWELLEQRRLTPCGFVCRTVRTRNARRELVPMRTYEFLLAPWSAELDGQLELALGPDGGSP